MTSGVPLNPDLRGWTPVAFHSEVEAVEWVDLRPHRFHQPFFIVERWQAAGGAAPIRTDLSVLDALDGHPSLDPDLIIAHPSRCGSTWLARLIAAADEQTILVSEPTILAQLMNYNLTGGLTRPVEQVLRQIVRAQGRIRFETERRYVLKLPSNMTRYLPEFRRAFPRTPIVWLQRQPYEIIESNLNNAATPARPMSPDETVKWVMRRVTLAFMAASAFVDDSIHVLDYRDLPGQALSKLLALMKITPQADDIARMSAVARLHGHNNKPYAPRPKLPLPDDLAAIVREALDPMYQALGTREANWAKPQ